MKRSTTIVVKSTSTDAGLSAPGGRSPRLLNSTECPTSTGDFHATAKQSCS